MTHGVCGHSTWDLLDVLSNHILVAIRWCSRPHGTEVAFGVPGNWVWSIVLPLLFPIHSPSAEVMDIHFHTSFSVGVEIQIQVLMPVASWCLSCCCGKYSEQRNLRQKEFILTPSAEHSVSCWESRQQEVRAAETASAVQGRNVQWAQLLVYCVLSTLCTLGDSLPGSCLSTIAVAGLPSSVEVIKIISAEAL